ncbi:ATP-binding protein [Hyphomonas sp. KY3]|uniref:ATP-binding protein n=1 Tax=Hyphomonas sp. KY3 TaxID=2016196 RepID=UPI001A8F9D2B|nr:ATP-binding protein [Hyphomonas sp. KY3]QSR23610.1 ATP-binding protein [Hyphomonas sp. KY3]
MSKQGTLFDKRFLGKHAGQIMSDPTTALVELVANAWDAYATKVSISWPSEEAGSPFRILDDGIGMTRNEFQKIWRTLDYNRLETQGPEIDPPPELMNALPRKVYGQNGRGRHAAFLFSSPYLVRTWRDANETTFRVSEGSTQPISVEIVQERSDVDGHGTEIIGERVIPSKLTSEEVRSILSTRFLLDPSFSVSVDEIKVTFEDIPPGAIEVKEVDIPTLGVAELRVIDSQKSDRTTKQHGIAWWVQNRLVGQADWTAFDGKFIDGRTEEARRYSFIVTADFLKPWVLPDWSDFDKNADQVSTAQDIIHNAIRDTISHLLRARRKETKEKVKQTFRSEVAELPQLSQDRWDNMLDELIEKCPTFGEKQISQVMGLLASMELAESKYSLLDKLSELSPDDVDAWNNILEEWTLRTAKAALDEVRYRLKLIEDIRQKTEDHDTDEVQDLQPLIEKSLWIFGPEYESIEYTSNRGMTTVLKRLFGSQSKGSLNRPDFVVLPDSTVGIYARAKFDSESNEVGSEAVVIVELKRPGVSLGSSEKNQAWKYIKELKSKGYIDDSTKVRAFILGNQIERGEGDERKEGENVVIRPILYATFVSQAEKRMLNLHKKLSDAPFMQSASNDDLTRTETKEMFS